MIESLKALCQNLLNPGGWQLIQFDRVSQSFQALDEPIYTYAEAIARAKTLQATADRAGKRVVYAIERIV